MGRIINNNKKVENDQYSDVEKELVHKIVSGEYVLVLGPDVILKDNYSEGNSVRYLNEQFQDWSNDNKKQYLDERATKRGLREFESMCYSYYDDDCGTLGDISLDVKELIEKDFFKLVITTAYDKYLECLMRKIYTDNKLTVLNIYSNADKTYQFIKDEYGEDKPVLFYAFGKIDSGYDFAYSDTDKLELLSRWLQGKNEWKNLYNYLKNKKILAIGCKHDDWFFRFFWYCLSSNIENMGNGNVAISLDTETSESDRNLKKYLEHIQVKNHGDAKVFIRDLNTKLSGEYVYGMISDSVTYAYGKGKKIFISYAHEDFFTTYLIARFLLNKGYSVWMDSEKLRGGNGYVKRITDAIAQCDVFIPILSTQVKKDLANINDPMEKIGRYYKDDEWNQIISYNNMDNEQTSMRKKIIPMLIFGFTKDDVNKLKLPQIFKNNHVVDWVNEGYSAIVKSLDENI